MTNDKDRKTPLSLSSKGKLEQRARVETGQVRQSFSHGRSKVVQVEVRRSRKMMPGAPGQAGGQNAGRGAVGNESGGLTEAEMETRRRALGEAARQAVEDEARQEREARERQEHEEAQARLRAEEKAREEAEPLERVRREEAEQGKAVAEPAPPVAVEPEVAQPSAEEQAVEQRPIDVTARVRPVVPPTYTRPAPVAARDEEEEGRSGKKSAGRGGAVPAKSAPSPKRSEPKRRGKLTISAALSGEEQAERARSIAAMRRAKQKEKRKQEGDQPAERVTRDVTIPDTITVQELANRMAERGANVIKSLMKMGVMATINQTIDADTAELVVTEFGHTVNRVSDSDVELGLIDTAPDPQGSLKPRPPVVTVMGHVDHGKTSLLDAMRSSNVVSGEAGGITQHIGAYQVIRPSGQRITFIDTPGHAAFTAMRARGAKVTDIVVLVVAANDGIMPQTIEAIRHAKAANVPIIVAINKIDLPDADPQKVATDLLQHEIVLESMGGDVLSVEVSAKKRLNLDKLEEAILLQAEILDLKANPDKPCQGVVIEAKVEKGRGSVATILVSSGTLRVGDIFVAGSEWGRVRALVDEHGKRIDEAGPAMPVEVLGFQGTPAAGDDFIVVADENRAREVSEYRQRKEREAQQVRGARSTMEQMFEKIQTGEARELPVVIKADVQGSVEALVGTFAKLGNDDVKVRVLHAAVGGINESDVTLAKASGALVLGFNVRANPLAREMARREGIEIRYHSIIYAAADEVKAMLTGMLEPNYKESFIGYAQIREVFSVSRVGKVAGCMVTEGVVKRGAKVRLLRDDVVIHEGNLGQLKRFKDDVREVREGYECGISLENYNDIQVGDLIECFEMEEIAVTL